MSFFFGKIIGTKKMREVRTINLVAVRGRELCYVSENEGFRFLKKGQFYVIFDNFCPSAPMSIFLLKSSVGCRSLELLWNLGSPYFFPTRTTVTSLKKHCQKNGQQPVTLVTNDVRMSHDEIHTSNKTDG